MRAFKLTIICSMLLCCFSKAQACTCSESGDTHAIYRGALFWSKSALVGRLVSVTINTVITTDATIITNGTFITKSIETTYFYQFQIEKVIRGVKFLDTMITVKDYEVTSFTFPSCFDTYHFITHKNMIRNGSFVGSLNSNYKFTTPVKVILFLDSSKIPNILHMRCRGSVSMLWTQGYEDLLVSLNQSLTATNIAQNQDSKTPSVNIFPNPCAEQTMLKYQVQNIGYIKIEIANSMGQVIKEIANYPSKPIGEHEESISLIGIPNGVYYCRIYTLTDIKVHRIIVNR